MPGGRRRRKSATCRGRSGKWGLPAAPAGPQWHQLNTASGGLSGDRRLAALLCFQRQQVALDGKDVCVVFGEVAQGLRKLQQVIAVGAARADRAGDLPRDLFFRRRAEKGGVVGGGDIDQAFGRAAIRER